MLSPGTSTVQQSSSGGPTIGERRRFSNSGVWSGPSPKRSRFEGDVGAWTPFQPSCESEFGPNLLSDQSPLAVTPEHHVPEWDLEHTTSQHRIQEMIDRTSHCICSDQL